LNLLSAVYGRVASLRRDWFANHPDRRHRLGCPVVSVGNLVVGGSGKTPVVAALAELLLRRGEHPAILSRGYRRHAGGADVVVVSDGQRIIEPAERSGDEPQLLARTVPKVPVLVARSRYEAGRLAEERFGSSVLLLDDGFQHVTLARDIDLLLVSPEDLHERILPAGVLREPLSSAKMADAVLVPGTEADVRRVSTALDIPRAFPVAARYLPPRTIPSNAEVDEARGARVVAVAGIARPGRFFAALRQLGWDVAAELTYRDHHWYSDRDLARVADVARRARATFVMTTEKDAMRLEGRTLTVVWAALPMRVSVGPDDEFASWIVAGLAEARRRMDR
jgi:tetraacyldisaccharide 4'-kinase